MSGRISVFSVLVRGIPASLLLLLTTFPVYVMAAESPPSNHDDLIALACDVFPEYEEYLKNPPVSIPARSSNGNIGEVISSETRSISDTESMTATLFSTGYVVIGYVYNLFIVEISDSGSQVGNDFLGNASFTVTTNEKGPAQFDLNNVGFIIHQNGTGYFTSYGTPSYYLVTPGKINNTTTDIDYPLTFHYGSENLYTTFSLGFDTSSGEVVVGVN